MENTMKVKLSVGNKAPDFKFSTPWENGLEFYKDSSEKQSVLVFYAIRAARFVAWRWPT